MRFRTVHKFVLSDYLDIDHTLYTSCGIAWDNTESSDDSLNAAWHRSGPFYRCKNCLRAKGQLL